jgi:Flp pilus assembly protein TadB
MAEDCSAAGMEARAEDPVARRQAALARQKIEAHEDRCSERWREARDEMKDLRRRVFETRIAMEQGHRRLTGWIIGGQGSVILLLAGVLLARSL